MVRMIVDLIFDLAVGYFHLRFHGVDGNTQMIGRIRITHPFNNRHDKNFPAVFR